MTLTFQGHPRSKVMSSVEPQYVITYITSVLTNSLRWTVNEIWAFLYIFAIFRVPWGTCLLNSGDHMFTTNRYHHQEEVYPKRTTDTEQFLRNLWNIDILAIFGYLGSLWGTLDWFNGDHLFTDCLPYHVDDVCTKRKIVTEEFSRNVWKYAILAHRGVREGPRGTP